LWAIVSQTHLVTLAAVNADETAALTTLNPPWDRSYYFANIFAKKSKK
jgi:hypothetical protein